MDKFVPKEPGYYWWRRHQGFSGWEVVRFWNYPTKQSPLVESRRHETPEQMALYGTFEAGPIQPPEEGK